MPPAISLLSYGRERINTVQQLKICIQFSHELVIQTEEYIDLSLLIGTDLQAKLGFQFL